MAQIIATSMSFGAAGTQAIPGTPNLTGNLYATNGLNRFDVSQYDSYSYHVFLTGSGNGTLSHLVSNNGIGFSQYPGQSVTIAGAVSSDFVFAIPANISQYAQLQWSGSGVGQLTASVYFFGRRQGGRS